jgi:hypothetical protein
VFEALSVNSTGARIARDMMERLKECGLRWSMYTPYLYFQLVLTYLRGDATIASELPYPSSKVQDFDGSNISQNAPPASNTASASKVPIHSLDERDASVPDFSFTTPSAWPAEIVDSMAWSVQFFGAVQSEE